MHHIKKIILFHFQLVPFRIVLVIRVNQIIVSVSRVRIAKGAAF